MERQNNLNRESNIELLRIIATLMVIVLHALKHGGVLDSYEFGTIGYVLFWFIEIICYVAVNIFILITGYFMVNLQFHVSRVLKLMIQVEFFSLFCLVAAKFLFHVDITLKDFIYSIFPLTGNAYWFASNYMLLIILVPFLNRLIQSMDKKELILGTSLLVFVFSVIATIFPWSRSRVLTYGYSFIWFIVLYFVGACIHKIKMKATYASKYMGIFIILSIVHLLCRLVIGYTSTKMIGYTAGINWLYSYNSVIVLLAAISLFLAFLQMKFKENTKRSKIISIFGRLSFGAYLCSDHNIIRKPLWKLCEITEKSKSIINVLIYILFIVFIIFLIGCFLEWFRLKIMKLIRLNLLLQKFDTYFGTLMSEMEKRIGIWLQIENES